MKIGSLVECVNKSGMNYWAKWGYPYTEIILPIVKNIYTVRDYDGDGHIRLEEIVNKEYVFSDGFTEPLFNVEDFREIEFPPSIEAEIKECLTREFELV